MSCSTAPLHTQMRYLDAHNLERSRSLSIKAKPLTIVLPNIDGKSVLLNLMDTPGTGPVLFRAEWLGGSADCLIDAVP